MIIKRKVKSAEDRAHDLLKTREKQRKRMIKTKYGQAMMKHSRKGIISCLYSGLVCIILCFMIIMSYITKGQIGILAGLVGLVIVVLAFKGFSSALKGFKERDKNYITCKVGVVCNGLLLLGLIIIFFRGLF